MSVPCQHPPASISGNDAPLIGARAATLGRGATEGGDEHGGVRRALIRSSSGSSEPLCPMGLAEYFASAPGPSVARHHAPLIDERAASRGRAATEGGDEHAGAKMELRAPSRTAMPAANDVTREARARR
jgi:hypothetical protein